MKFNPELEILMFSNEDILTASTATDPTNPWETPPIKPGKKSTGDAPVVLG